MRRRLAGWPHLTGTWFSLTICNAYSMSPTYGLLALLARGPRYGYDLKRQIDGEFAPFWQIDYAQLYRSLAKLTQQGDVRVRAQNGSAGPDRKLYALTAKGKQALAEWLSRPAGDRSEFLVKLRLAEFAGISSAPLVEAQRREWDKTKTDWQQARRAALQSGNAARLLLADAGLRDIETSRAVLELSAATLGGTSHSQSSRPGGLLEIIGSDDPLLARLAGSAHASVQPLGSLAGLLALSRHEAEVAGVHLLDVDTGEYNVPFVRHLLPEDDLVLVNLAFRENGLLLAPGNPKRIRSVRDLARDGVRFINRPRGTGTRLLLAARLRAAHIDPHSLPDWERVAATHEAVAAAIHSGAADVGPGLRAVAVEWSLEFIPLGQERFDLVVPSASLDSPRVLPLLETLHGQVLARGAENLVGYDLSQTGRIIARVN